MRRASRQALNSSLPVIGINPITITIQAMVPFVVIRLAEALALQAPGSASTASLPGELTAPHT
jgi:hypothetical protein